MKTLVVSRVRLARITVVNMRVMYVLLSDNLALKKQSVRNKLYNLKVCL